MEINPICLECKHYKSEWKCKAFEKIPEEIINGNNPHTEPFKGDNGIQFEEQEK